MTICFFETKKKNSRYIFWPVLVAYYTAIVSQHLRFSEWLTSHWHTPFGDIIPANGMSAIGKAGAVMLGAWVLLRAVRGGRLLFSLALWFAWWTCLLVVLYLFLFNNNELFHFPQYAILALLLSRCLDPDGSRQPSGSVLFWSALLGMFDEVYQYFFLCPSYGLYLDFNDALFNIVAAAGGLLLRYSFTAPPPGQQQRSGRGIASLVEVAVSFFCGLLCSALLISGLVRLHAPQEIPPGGLLCQQEACTVYLERRPSIAGSWLNRPLGGRYYVLTPLQGVTACVLTGSVFSLLPAGLSKLKKQVKRSEKKTQKGETP